MASVMGNKSSPKYRQAEAAEERGRANDGHRGTDEIGETRLQEFAQLLAS